MISSINSASFKTGSGVDATFFHVTNSILGLTYYVAKTKAIKWAENNRCTLIQDGRYYYLDDLERYVLAKKRNLLFSYRWYIEKLVSAQFYAERNERNNRLDHNLTSLPKAALQIIKRDNDLVELDLSNSQFAIHSHWLRREGLDKKYKDVQLYCDISASGLLYEHLMEILSVTRNEAKKLMMELAFSSHKNNTKAKKTFKDHFPNVVGHIDGFKQEKAKDPKLKKNGYKEFAVELQKMEAEIFVDNLYPNIKELGLFCLTKHDSLLFRRKDMEVVMAIVREYFNHLGFQASYKVE